MNDTLIIFILIAFAAIPVAKIVWLRLIQPIRLKFADMGREILEDPKTSPEQREAINTMLDDAYNWQFGIALAAFASPAFIIATVSRIRNKDSNSLKTRFHIIEEHPDGDAFINQFIACILLSNPIAGLIAMIQMLVIGLVLILCFMSYNKAKNGLEALVFSNLRTWASWTSRDDDDRMRYS